MINKINEKLNIFNDNIAYVEIWGAYQPKQIDNFYNLRLDEHAQKEIRLVAEAMKELSNELQYKNEN